MFFLLRKKNIIVKLYNNMILNIRFVVHLNFTLFRIKIHKTIDENMCLHCIYATIDNKIHS